MTGFRYNWINTSLLIIFIFVSILTESLSELNVIPILSRSFYAPGETVDLMLYYYDDNSFVKGEKTVIEIYDSKNELYKRTTVYPEGESLWVNLTLPETKDKKIWFGWWEIKIVLSNGKTVSGGFEVRRDVGKRYYRTRYEARSNILGSELYGTISAAISHGKTTYFPKIDETIPINIVYNTEPFSGPVLLRVFDSKARDLLVYKNIDFIKNGIYRPTVNLPEGEYYFILTVFKDSMKADFTKTLRFYPAITITPSRVCNGRKHPIMFLHPDTLLPLKHIEVYTSKGEILYTDENGMLEFVPHPGENIIFYKIGNLKSSIKFYSSSCSLGSWTDISISSDRPIYNPGQTVYYRGYVWKWQNERIKPVQQNVTITLYDNKGFEILRVKSESNKYGIYHGDFVLPMNIDEGIYRLSVSGGKSIKIEIKFFERKQLITDIATDKEEYNHGEIVKGNVSARYYFGKPARGASVRVIAWWATIDISHVFSYPVHAYSYPITKSYIRAYPVMPEYPAFRRPSDTALIKLEKAYEINTTVGENGFASFNIPLGDLKGTHLIIEVDIKDDAGRKADVSKIVSLAPKTQPRIELKLTADNRINATLTLNNNIWSNIKKVNLVVYGVTKNFKQMLNLKNLTVSTKNINSKSYSFIPDISKEEIDRYVFLVIRLIIVDIYGRTYYDQDSILTPGYSIDADTNISEGFLNVRLNLKNNKNENISELPVRQLYWGLYGPDYPVSIFSINSRGFSDSIKIPVAEFPDGIYTLTLRLQIGSKRYGINYNIHIPVKMGNRHKIKIWRNKKSIKAGETAEFTYSISGFSRTQFIMEVLTKRGNIINYRIVEATSDNNITVRYNTDEGDFGNIGLSIIFIADNSIRYTGQSIINIMVPTLLTDISIDKKDYKPGEPLKIKVSVKDKFGQPVSSAALGLKITDKSVIDAAKTGPYSLRPIGDRNYFPAATGFMIKNWESYYYNMITLEKTTIAISPYYNIKDKIDYLDGVYEAFNIATFGSAGIKAESRTLKKSVLSVRAKEEAIAESLDVLPSPMEALGEKKEMEEQIERDEMSEEEVAETISQIKMREKFPETAYWLPFVLTDENGVFEDEITLPDTLTTWQINVYSSTIDCRYSENSTSFITRKDFFIEPNLPGSLTQGDNVTLSITAYNYIEPELKTTVGIKKEDWFDIYTPNTASFMLKINRPLSVSWNIRAIKPFYHNLTFFSTASSEAGKDYSDGVIRQIWVRPNGVSWKKRVSSSTVKSYERFQIYVPDEMYNITLRGYGRFGSEALAIYNTGYIIDGYTYPATDVVVSWILPRILKRDYRKYLKIYYDPWMGSYIQRRVMQLVFMQHDDSGWGWWKKGPSTPYMTALAIKGLAAASRVIYVSNNYIIGGLNWLTSHQNPDGSWNETTWFTGNRPAMTAELLYLIKDAIAEKPSSRYVGTSAPKKNYMTMIEKALGFLHNSFKNGDIDDPYTLAMYGLLIQHYNKYQGDMPDIIEKLEALKKSDGDYIYWARGYSRGGPDETTARVAQFFINIGGDYLETGKKALDWIREQNPWEFTTVSDSIAIYEAYLTLFRVEPPEVPNMIVKIYVNGLLVDSFRLKGVWGSTKELRLTPYLKKGNNTIEIKREGKGKLFYDVWFTGVLGGKVSAEVSQLQSPDENTYPISVKIKSLTEEAIISRMKIKFPEIQGLKIIPSQTIYIEKILPGESKDIRVIYVATGEEIKLPDKIPVIRAEYQLSYIPPKNKENMSGNIQGLQFASWKMPYLKIGKPAMKIKSIELHKKAEYVNELKTSVKITLSVINNMNNKFTGQILDYIPAGLSVKPETKAILVEGNRIKIKTTIEPGEEKRFIYYLSGSTGVYDIGEALLTGEATVKTSEYIGKIMIYGDNIGVKRKYSRTYFKIGSIGNVSIKIASARHYGRIIVEEKIPPGFVLDKYTKEGKNIENVIVKKDRIIWFITHMSENTLWYTIRAVSDARVQAQGTHIYPADSPEYGVFSGEKILRTGRFLYDIADNIDTGNIIDLSPLATKHPTQQQQISELPPAQDIEQLKKLAEIKRISIKQALKTFKITKAASERIKSVIEESEMLIRQGKIEEAYNKLIEAEKILDENIIIESMDYNYIFIAIIVAISSLALIKARRMTAQKRGYISIIAPVFALIVLGIIFIYATEKAENRGLNRVSIEKKNVFIYPEIAIETRAPVGGDIDIYYHINLRLINRQEKPVYKILFELDQPALEVVEKRYYNYRVNIEYINGKTRLVFDFTKHPLLIGETRNAYVYLKTRLKTVDLKSVIHAGFQTDCFLKTYKITARLYTGQKLNITTIKPKYEKKDRWNPDTVVWQSELQELEFSDRLSLDFVVSLDAVSIQSVKIEDILTRNLRRTRRWDIVYQNIGKPVYRLRLDLGDNVKLETGGMKYHNGNIILDKPLNKGESIRVIARQEWGAPDYGAIIMKTTMDEIKRAISPAESYEIHVKIYGLTVEYAHGIPKVYKKQRDGIEEYKYSGKYPVSYSIRVVT